MKFFATKAKVHNRGALSDAFLTEMVEWARTAPDAIFKKNNKVDIYNKVQTELGPYRSLQHRKAVMLEVMRVLALFESSGDWNEGVDTSRAGADTKENSEAGAWQVSYDSRKLALELRTLLAKKGIDNGTEFQQKMKSDHPLAMEYVARLMRNNTKHNGPLYKAGERKIIRASLRAAKHSIYPWLSRSAVAEFQKLLS